MECNKDEAVDINLLMECNKVKAVRAKHSAESRMQKGRFGKALKYANKAKKLYADVDNIAQIIAICEVHVAASNKLSCSDMDWYRILQTERFSEEAIINKQYRKLALLLHPDKNKFAGAEDAFKLIGEANSALSDQAKRSLYDMKVRGHVRTAEPKTPSHHSNGNNSAASTPEMQEMIEKITAALLSKEVQSTIVRGIAELIKQPQQQNAKRRRKC